MAPRADHPVQLARRSQLLGLAEVANEFVADLATLAVGPDERQVAIRSITPTHGRGLHLHRPAFYGPIPFIPSMVLSRHLDPMPSRSEEKEQFKGFRLRHPWQLPPNSDLISYGHPYSYSTMSQLAPGKR
jgi:hypothetical protein